VVFGVGQLNDVSQILPQPTVLVMTIKFEKFEDKMGYNSPATVAKFENFDQNWI